MLEFRQDMQEPPAHWASRAPQVPKASQAERLQRSGLAKLQALRGRVSHHSLGSATPLAPTPENRPPPPLTEDEQRVRERQLQREADAAIDAEIEKHIRDGIIEGNVLGDFHILPC